MLEYACVLGVRPIIYLEIPRTRSSFYINGQDSLVETGAINAPYSNVVTTAISTRKSKHIRMLQNTVKIVMITQKTKHIRLHSNAVKNVTTIKKLKSIIQHSASAKTALTTKKSTHIRPPKKGENILNG